MQSVHAAAVSPSHDWVEVQAPMAVAKEMQPDAGTSLQYKIVCVDDEGYETSSPWVSMPPHDLVATILLKRDSNPAVAILFQGVSESFEEYLAQYEGFRLSPDALHDVAALLLDSAARSAKKCYMLSSSL